jgi:hypothetical protein
MQADACFLTRTFLQYLALVNDGTAVSELRDDENILNDSRRLRCQRVPNTHYCRFVCCGLLPLLSMVLTHSGGEASRTLGALYSCLSRIWLTWYNCTSIDYLPAIRTSMTCNTLQRQQKQRLNTPQHRSQQTSQRKI